MPHVYTGEVRNGVIVPDKSASPLADGTKVRIEPVDMEAAVQDLSRVLLSLAGKAKGLPSDLAEQHDHYLHGTPKR